MHRKDIIMISVIMLLLVGCAEEVHDPDQVTLGIPFNLSEGKTTEVRENGDYVLTVFVQSIAETRCPVKATCISAGNAFVTLQVYGYEEKLTTIELCIGECTNYSDEVVVEIDNIDRTFRLADVRPYPEVDKDPPRYAMLVIE